MDKKILIWIGVLGIICIVLMSGCISPDFLKSGVCCINSDVGAIRDYIKNDFNGFFYYTKDELYNLLEKLLKDGKLRKKIGKNASESVKEYTWENTVSHLNKVFEKYQ